MYGFNYILFRRLSDVLKVSNYSIAEELSLDRSTFYDRLSDGNIKLLHLIKICNHYHIPIKHFVNGDFVPDRDVTKFYYTQPRWQDITWKKEGVRTCLKNAKGMKLTQKEIAKSIGVAIPTLLNWATDESTISVPNALALCNLTGTDLKEMVVDLNSWAEPKDALPQKGSDKKPGVRAKKPKKDIEQEIQLLWERLDKLEKYVEEIQESLHLLCTLSAAKPRTAYAEQECHIPITLNEEPATYTSNKNNEDKTERPDEQSGNGGKD